VVQELTSRQPSCESGLKSLETELDRSQPGFFERPKPLSIEPYSAGDEDRVEAYLHRSCHQGNKVLASQGLSSR
jgi:hypothetical protein